MKKINVLISTFFGYGYLTKIPGTVTSLVTTVFIYIAYEYLGFADLKFSIIFFTLLFFYSFYAVKDSENEFKNKDPRQIVIDEVLGQAMPLIFVLHLSQNNQLSLPIEVYYVLSFIFFRFFDIIKPVGLVYIGIKKGKTLLIKENRFKSKKRNLIQTLTVKEVIKTMLKLI
jgi:phosphatidylglycerophosphatase A